MGSHDTIGIKLQPFIVNTVLKAFKQDVFVNISDKQINPINDSKRNKV
jgi:hypothetical protein